MNLIIEKLNESFLRVYSNDRGIEQSISDYFTFFIDGAKFMPLYKSGVWDGKARLYNLQKKTLPFGLLNILIQYCIDNDIEYDNKILPYNSNIEYKSFVDNLKLASKSNQLSIRDYQYDAINHAINNKRCVLLSPTASGKSSIMYTIIRWALEHNKKILILVPATNLIEQLYSDFEDYSSINGWNTSDNIQKVYSGFTKDKTHNVYLSTWQSLYKFPQKHFEDFDFVITDETHLATGKSLTSIVEKCVNAEYKIGLSGTIDKKKINRLTLTGLFGPIYEVTTTSKLMEMGHITNLKINSILLKYPIEECKLLKGIKYQKEMDYIVTNPKRNNFIANLAIRTNGNTLLLFQYVEKHGKILYDIISKMTDRPVYYISGEISTLEREKIRKELNEQSNAILIASVQTTSTGVNIPALDNIIFASPTKSIYRVLQSIGRILRLKDGKIVARVFDIGDDYSYGKSYKNTTLLHFIERIKIYINENLEYKIKNVQL